MKTKLLKILFQIFVIIFIFVAFSAFLFSQEEVPTTKPTQIPKLTPEQQKFLDQFNVMTLDPKNQPLWNLILSKIKKGDQYLQQLFDGSFSPLSNQLFDYYRQGEKKYNEAERKYSESLLFDKFNPFFLEQNRQISELDGKSFDLARAYKEAFDQNEKDRIQKELETTLSKLFDLKEDQREGEIKKLENDLNRMKDKVTQRKKNKGMIIRKRIEQMLDKKEDLEW